MYDVYYYKLTNTSIRFSDRPDTILDAFHLYQVLSIKPMMLQLANIGSVPKLWLWITRHFF